MLKNLSNKKLYKRDSNGKIRTWMIEYLGEGHDNTVSYRMITGVENGASVMSTPTIVVGKNLGRANETSAEEQAEKEIIAAYKKKGKRAYVADRAYVDKVTIQMPMLATKYEDQFHKHGFTLYFSQPKLDGFRCLATPDGLFSRKSEPFNSCPHIEKKICELAKKYGVTFDGELYNHEFKDDFNKIQSLITKKNLSDEDLAESADKIQYHIYDIVTDEDFLYRSTKIMNIFEEELQGMSQFVRVITTACNDKVIIDGKYDEYLNNGYEGQMLRTNVSYQKGKRSKHLMKRKEIMDEEFEIVEVLEGKGNRSGMAGKIRVKLNDGQLCKAGITGGLKVNKHMWTNPEEYIGKMATIRFFGYTPDNSLRFPRFKTIRRD